MDFSIRNADTTSTEIRLNGSMTFADHESFRTVMAAIDGPPGHRMVFDLSGLDFVDSSGLGMFMIARETAEKKNMDFWLRGARDEVRRLMSVAKLQKLFKVAD